MARLGSRHFGNRRGSEDQTDAIDFAGRLRPYDARRKSGQGSQYGETLSTADHSIRMSYAWGAATIRPARSVSPTVSPSDRANQSYSMVQRDSTLANAAE